MILRAVCEVLYKLHLQYIRRWKYITVLRDYEYDHTHLMYKIHPTHEAAWYPIVLKESVIFSLFYATKEEVPTYYLKCKTSTSKKLRHSSIAAWLIKQSWLFGRCCANCPKAISCVIFATPNFCQRCSNFLYATVIYFHYRCNILFFSQFSKASNISEVTYSRLWVWSVS